ncbi:MULTISPECIES: GGDEF domain-containing protein [Aquincola]|uniref:GGDEF domain-containing protein n=1 Tax=Aquincola TaxID=391952 RepID=UPI0009F8DDED|nr:MULTISPECIES: GGDEF domain-containing protein [Aquincola]MCR5865277.1 GGDEF domain-containing protein [Aquincola sp. J276]
MSTTYQLLAIGPVPADLAGSAWGPFVVTATTFEEANGVLHRQPFDAVLMTLDEDEMQQLPLWPALSHAVLDAAVLVVTPQVSPLVAMRLLQAGVQDVLSPNENETLPRRVRLGIERKQLDRTARKAHATDLATGLPNHAQLQEHMTHLLALREREPAPMALVVLRIEGFATAAARMGGEAANVLRRKVAVRLRAGLRASDVVASVGHDVFAVLLAWVDNAEDVPGVVNKLVASLQRPFSVAGGDVAVAVSAGVGHYPEHGKDAGALMRRAMGQAASMAPVGRAGFANRVERGPSAAANDEDAPGE